MQSVDHTKLHNHIVQKAFEVSSAFLTDAQAKQLFQSKVERAEEALKLRSLNPIFRTER